MDLKDLEEIIALMKQNDVVEFELEREGTHIRLTRAVKGVVASMSSPHHLEPAIIHAPSIENSAINNNHTNSVNQDHLVKVESPIVGTFYRKPSPDAEPFVKEGDSIKKGSTLCIVEAMKLMNEIEAPCSGRVEKICLADAQVAEFGEVLFLINPNA